MLTLFSVDSKLPTKELPHPERRSTQVRQLDLGWLPPPQTDPPVWASLEDKQRAEVVEVLSRLIVKVAAAEIVTANKEAADE